MAKSKATLAEEQQLVNNAKKFFGELGFRITFEFETAITMTDGFWEVSGAHGDFHIYPKE